MINVYVDESGDLGFREGSSRWFVFTLLLTGDRRSLGKAIKRVHRGLRKKFRKVHELHAYHADEATRRRVLEHIARLDDVQVLAVVLNKEKVHVNLRAQWMRITCFLK